MSSTSFGTERTYTLDAQDRVVAVDDGWDRFAAENGGTCDAGSVTGRPLWDFVSGIETRHLWESLFGRIRDSHRAAVIPFRCDAPGLRRFLVMDLVPRKDGGLEIATRVVREEPRAHVALLDSGVERSARVIKMCSWCKRLETEGGWLEVEDAAPALDLFGEPPVPLVSHGVCPDCVERLEGDEMFAEKSSSHSSGTDREHRPRVVVVDDSPAFLEVLSREVERIGCDVVGRFEDGGPALAGIETASPDLVVLDLVMPGTNGFDVIQRLHASGAPPPRIVVVSLHDDEAHRTMCSKLGANGFVAKTRLFDDLEPTLHEVLGS